MQFLECAIMPAKKKPTDIIHSITGARASSPLTIKLKNNLVASKKKLALRSVVKVVNNDKQSKKKHVSFHEDVPAQPPADILGKQLSLMPWKNGDKVLFVQLTLCLPL